MPDPLSVAPVVTCSASYRHRDASNLRLNRMLGTTCSILQVPSEHRPLTKKFERTPMMNINHTTRWTVRMSPHPVLQISPRDNTLNFTDQARMKGVCSSKC